MRQKLNQLNQSRKYAFMLSVTVYVTVSMYLFPGKCATPLPALLYNLTQLLLPATFFSTYCTLTTFWFPKTKKAKWCFPGPLRFLLHKAEQAAPLLEWIPSCPHLEAWTQKQPIGSIQTFKQTQGTWRLLKSVLEEHLRALISRDQHLYLD